MGISTEYEKIARLIATELKERKIYMTKNKVKLTTVCLIAGVPLLITDAIGSN